LMSESEGKSNMRKCLTILSVCVPGYLIEFGSLFSLSSLSSLSIFSYMLLRGPARSQVVART
jgi:hypothetical protein